MHQLLLISEVNSQYHHAGDAHCELLIKKHDRHLDYFKHQKRAMTIQFLTLIIYYQNDVLILHHLYAHHDGKNFNRILSSQQWQNRGQDDKHTSNIYSSDIILYRNMAATNAMIFSLDYILYSKLPRSLYKPLFHTLYWLDGCCLVRGCDIIWRRPHVASQNKKT